MVEKKKAGVKTPVKNSKEPSALSPEKLVEEISKRAYEIHLKRGCAHGSNTDDWLKAEQEIKAKYRIA
jgi:hypothetical protein